MEKQYYPCINVAFMHYVFHNEEKAQEYAKAAREICRKIRAKGAGSYWVQATEAEASLILGQVDAALEAYAKAVGMEDAQPAHVASTRKQALQIASLFEESDVKEKLERAFPLLGIVACSGHVIDNPGRERRFPPEAEMVAKEKSNRLWISWGQLAASVRLLAVRIFFFWKRWLNEVEKLMFFFLFEVLVGVLDILVDSI